MKLIITIPAFNEEKTIEEVIKSIPKNINGINEIQVLVVDDGSTDNTARIAEKNNAIVLKHKKNLGLAKSFKDALDKALELNADIIVNTDADNQYDQKEIPKLVQPIIEGKADIVLGSRFKGKIEEMPLTKKIGNIIATTTVNFVSKAKISDAQTGFRAFSRNAAAMLNIQSSYTYTQETIIQAMFKGLKIIEVPVVFRKRKDKSRLISSIWIYAIKTIITIIRSYLSYKPLKFFGVIGLLFILAGFIVGFKVLMHFIATSLVSPFIPSALLASVLIIIGIEFIAIGLVAETIKANRLTLEEILFRQKNKKN